MKGKTVRTLKRRKLFLAALRDGLSVSNAATKSAMSRAAVYDWRGDDEEFAKDWDDALEGGTDLLEDEATRRALHGTDEPVFQNGKHVGSVRRYSDTLIIFLLKARRAKFRDMKPITDGPEDGSLKALLKATTGAEAYVENIPVPGGAPRVQ